MKITIFTLFPDWFNGPLGDSIILRARERGILSIECVNFRDWSEDAHHSVDDAPYGGGGGMVIRADVVARAMDESIGAPGSAERPHVIHMSPRGRPFTQEIAMELATRPSLAILCGHYEAIDERLLTTRVDEEISLGDFVLTGGEIPAMAVVDAVTRMLDGALGNDSSAECDSFMNGLLEGPHYTRPEVFEGMRVPDVLLSGNHKAIEDWREERAMEITQERRPDLFQLVWLQYADMQRLARRRRHFAIWRRTADDRIEVLFATKRVQEMDSFPAFLGRLRSTRGVSSDIQFAEISRASSGDTEHDAREVVRDVAEVMSAAHARRFAKNFLKLVENYTSDSTEA